MWSITKAFKNLKFTCKKTWIIYKQQPKDTCMNEPPYAWIEGKTWNFSRPRVLAISRDRKAQIYNEQLTTQEPIKPHIFLGNDDELKVSLPLGTPQFHTQNGH